MDYTVVSADYNGRVLNVNAFSAISYTVWDAANGVLCQQIVGGNLKALICQTMHLIVHKLKLGLH